MTVNASDLATLVAKDQIRELVLLYSRGVDRKDAELLRSLYTADATDTHGDVFDGTVSEYIAFMQKSFPAIFYAGHHVCNHLISVDGDEGEGEVYALAYHVIPDGRGGQVEDLIAVRYLDRYRREEGQWKFAKRVVEFDHRIVRPLETPFGAMPMQNDDASYKLFKSKLFQRKSGS